jgi:hypothetical protein
MFLTAASLGCYSLPWCFLYAGVARELSNVSAAAAWAAEKRKVWRRAIVFGFESHGDWRLDYIVVELSLWCFWYFFED